MGFGAYKRTDCPIAFCTSFPFQKQDRNRALSAESFHLHSTASRLRWYKRRRALLLCHAGNGISENNSGEKNKDPSKPTSKTDLPFDATATKKRLLELLPSLINDDSQITEVELLLRRLESLNNPAATEVFTEMALAGSWKLLFTSMRGKTSGNIRIRRIGQDVFPDKKLIINRSLWTFRGTPAEEDINATLDVECSYKFVRPTRLELEVQEHKIQILDRPDGKANQLPSDMTAVISELRLGLPLEFFDPSGLIDVSYIEPNFRVARFMGKRLSGVRNVFIRND